MDAEASQLLSALRSFVLNLPERVAPKEGMVSRAEVVRPLLAAASEGLVWRRGTKEPTSRWGDRHVEFPAEIVVRERGRWRLDLTREVYTGYGSFWYGSDRGSIALRLPRLPSEMGEIFGRCPKLPHSSAVGILASRNQLLQADSAAAVRYCDRAIDGGEYALLFPPGANLVSLFAPHDELVRLYRLANERCPMHGGRRKLYHGPPGGWRVRGEALIGCIDAAPVLPLSRKWSLGVSERKRGDSTEAGMSMAVRFARLV